MTTQELLALARCYFVNDLPGSTIPSSRLSSILEKIHACQPLTIYSHGYLQQLGLGALGQLVLGKMTFESFQAVAATEQLQREHLAEAERQATYEAMLVSEAEQKAREAAYWAQREAARQAQERDPKYIAKIKNQALRARFGIDLFIEQEHFSRLMNILYRLDEGNRLTDDDVLWLTTEGSEYFSMNIQTAFHAREAEFFVGEYLRTYDPWNVVNASGHYRKCSEPRKAHDLLISISPDRQKVPKLRSAIATTHGGVMRDLSRLDEALALGIQAHSLTPRDFRPCTLLGAVNFELGHFLIGTDWYAKAIARGATERSIDSDLRGIFLRADPIKREKIKSFLLGEDPDRYNWVNQKFNRSTSTEARTGQHRDHRRSSSR